MADVSMIPTCSLCLQPVNLEKSYDFSRLTERGYAGLNRASIARNLPEINYSENDRPYVHKECRHKHTHPTAVRAAQRHDKSTLTSHKNMQSNATAFDLKQNCLFCGIFVDQKESFKHPKRGTAQFRRVMEIEFGETIKEHCAQRQDEWAALVESRILAVFDLPAADAIYNPDCDKNFRAGKQIPSRFIKEEVPIKNQSLGVRQM